MSNHAAATPAAPTAVSAQGLLERRCEDLIAAETTRLARRASALRPDQLTEVAAALRRVAGQLVLAHTNAISDTQLAVLFDLAGTP
jgi:hypothetical protein